MLSPDSRDRVAVIAIGLLVILAPALFMLVTLEFLILTGDIIVSDLTAIEIIELYLIDLVLLVGFGYGIYRLSLWLIERSPSESDEDEQSGADNGESTDAGETR